MARARNIKPGFFKNEDLAECSPWARLCFAGLWTLADREGRLEDRPKRIKGELFAFDSIEVEPLLVELQARGFLVRYRNEDGNFIQISKFSAHQTPHYSEKPSVIKPPELQESPQVDDSKTPGTLQEDSKNPQGIKGGSQPPDSLIPDSLIPDSPKEGGAPGSPAHTREPAREGPPPEDPPPEAAGHQPTAAGLACKAMRKAGLSQTNPGDPRLLALLEQGATVEELAGIAAEAAQHSPPKGFAWVLKVVQTRRAEAQAITLAPPAPPRPANGRADPTATTPTPPGAVYVPPPPLSPEERARADVARQEAMAKLRTRRPAAS